MTAQARPALPLSDALRSSQPLALLAERLRESKRRFDCIAPVLPNELAVQVQPGPVDEHGWTLLAANGAVAAKLRQLVPLFDTSLAAAGFSAVPIRVKVTIRMNSSARAHGK